jgi:hypothetical protein
LEVICPEACGSEESHEKKKKFSHNRLILRVSIDGKKISRMSPIRQIGLIGSAKIVILFDMCKKIGFFQIFLEID